MDTMDHSLKGVTVEAFVETLRDATANLGVVQPAELRAPLALWLRAVEARAVGEGWTHLLGRPVVSAWNAARAVVDAAGE
jgi:hypothetical protein